MSAKELGMVHSVTTSFAQTPGQNKTDYQIDVCGLLSDTLQRNVRQGQYFKVVGIDVTCSPNIDAPGNGGSINGFFRYYRPTRGRCAAYRYAFKSMAEQMKLQGIAMRENKGYDFRAKLNNDPTNPTFKNQATLDGVQGLCLNADVTAPGASIFEVYNKSVLPTLTTVPAADLFDGGFDTLLSSGVGKTDFVLNDSDIYSGNEDYADLSYDTIPFQLEFTETGSGTQSASATFQWRPDPALYVAVMTGQFDMYIDTCTVAGTATSLDMNLTFYVSGWKSIMGDPDKKKSRSRRKTRRNK